MILRCLVFEGACLNGLVTFRLVLCLHRLVTFRSAGPRAARGAVPSLRASARRTGTDGRPARLCLSPASMRVNPGFLSPFGAVDRSTGM